VRVEGCSGFCSIFPQVRSTRADGRERAAKADKQDADRSREVGPFWAFAVTQERAHRLTQAR